MKTTKLYICAIIILMAVQSKSQPLNWAAVTENHQNTAGVNMGVEYGITYGFSYSHTLKVYRFPLLAGIEFSVPSGDKRTDDHKSKVGVQVRWIEYGRFQFSTRIQGVFRQYQNDFVNMLNFGSDMAGVAGYYKSRWFAAGEIGFDKAIVSHFKHKDLYRKKYSDVVDGWYEPSSGGNFYYGIQGGLNFKQHGITLKAGKVISQDFRTDPLIPYYAQIGYNLKF